MKLNRFNQFKLNENVSKNFEIETYLPIFPGYYNTIFDYDNYDDEDYDEEVEYDYQDYFIRRAKAMVEKVEDYLVECGFDIKLEFEELRQPKEYNFSNDSINIKVKFNQETLDEIVSFLEDNEDDFSSYIKEDYSIRPGFIPYHSTDFDEWKDAIKNLNNKIEHKLGYVLNFILEMNDDYLQRLAEDTAEEEYFSIKN